MKQAHVAAVISIVLLIPLPTGAQWLKYKTPGIPRTAGLTSLRQRRACLILNSIIEQDHRFIKRRLAASVGFRSAEGAWRTIDGYEAML